MRIIIAGSRGYRGGVLGIESAIRDSGFTVTTVISGVAKGADLAGEWWAKSKGIPCERFPAQWNEFGKSAGMIRNQQMADAADALIALWDGKSRGTEAMIRMMKNKPSFVYWDTSWG